MSRTYQMNTHSSKVIESLKTGKIRGLKHYANPDKTSLWPDGVTDGENYAWFESSMLLAWGQNNESILIRKLRNAGISMCYVG